VAASGMTVIIVALLFWFRLVHMKTREMQKRLEEEKREVEKEKIYWVSGTEINSDPPPLTGSDTIKVYYHGEEMHCGPNPSNPDVLVRCKNDEPENTEDAPNRRHAPLGDIGRRKFGPDSENIQG